MTKKNPDDIIAESFHTEFDMTTITKVELYVSGKRKKVISGKK